MNVAAKLGVYGAALAAVLGGGAAIGAAAGPIDVGDPDHGGGHVASADELPAGGLLVSQAGYTLVADHRVLDGGAFGFTIMGPDGHPLEEYDIEHERELHLIVASRDLSAFAHVHPERDGHGHWAVDLPALPAGAYRAFADFSPADVEGLTLGIDVAVPGSAATGAPLVPRLVDDVDGFEVTLDGDVDAAAESEVTVTVRRDGEVVTTDPYLGAAGHLVALRDGDLAYLHVHPLDDEPVGPVRFAVEVPSTGAYALFFDFLVDGEVRTARFVVTA